MSFIIDDNLLEEIRDKVDIYELISQYVNLKRSGANYIGLCPFHNEKTPSFSLSPSKGIFKCFGCGEGGDVISFVMKREGLGFREAIKFLADKYNIELRQAHYSKKDKELKDKAQRFYEINRQAALFFYNNLKNSKLGMNYLRKREISPAVINKYGLGFANDSWDNLKNHLLSLGYKEEELVEINLLSSSKGKTYDRFRNRIMFPIIDTKGRVIAFGGRVLGDEKPKYLNSSENLIFHKGSNLFNLNLISKEASRDKIILVEGYMDVISLYNSGINYSVASLGTSLTQAQAGLIKRYAKDIYICYDGDSAGINATVRAIDIMLSEGISPKIISLAEGLDPDEYIKKYGKISFEGQVANGKSFLDFKIDNLKGKYNLSSSDGLSKFTMEAGKILSSIKNPIERDVYMKNFCKTYGISTISLNSYISLINKNRPKKKFDKPKKIIKPKGKLQSGNIKAQKGLIAYCLAGHDFYDYIKSKVELTLFSSVEIRIIFEELENYYDKKIEKDDFFKDLINKGLVSSETYKEIISLIVDEPEGNKIISDYLLTLKRSWLLQEKENLLNQLDSIAKSNSKDKEIFEKVINDLRTINLELNDINEGVKDEWEKTNR